MIGRFGLLVLLCVALPCAAAPRLLVMGDSLAAGFGIPVEKGWVALLQQRLGEQGYPHTVVNASISGETTAGGLARLPAALDRHQPEIVLIELGANDGLRGLSLKTMRANLAKMITLAQNAGAHTAVFEMRIPPNYGPAYTEEFHGSFARAARPLDAVLVPFFLESVALDPDYFLDDGIHPNIAAQPRLLEAVWPHLKPLLMRK